MKKVFITLAIIAYFALILYGLFELFKISVCAAILVVFIVAGLTCLALNNQ